MANEKRLIDEFKSELMSKFIDLCRGNDYNKLTLLRIGETIDRIYEKYSTLPAVDAVEVVRCKYCVYLQQDDVNRNFCGLGDFYCGETDFCSRGERRSIG